MYNHASEQLAASSAAWYLSTISCAAAVLDSLLMVIRVMTAPAANVAMCTHEIKHLSACVTVDKQVHVKCSNAAGCRHVRPYI
jgi:hypothetical protein